MESEQRESAAAANLRRVEQGRQALAGYNEDWDEQTNLIDLLAGVMHWAAAEKVDFENALRIARGHFETERA